MVLQLFSRYAYALESVSAMMLIVHSFNMSHSQSIRLEEQAPTKHDYIGVTHFSEYLFFCWFIYSKIQISHTFNIQGGGGDNSNNPL